jgi:hypothetical protein
MARCFLTLVEPREELRKQSELELKQMVLNLQNFRNPLASQTRHPLYRAQSERWLQSVVQQDVSALMSRCFPSGCTNKFLRKPPRSTEFSTFWAPPEPAASPFWS